MIKQIEPYLDILRDILIFANTPRYLYKNFRKQLSEAELTELPSSDIFNEFNKVYKEQGINTIDTCTYLYALLILLTLDDYSEVKEYLIRLRGTKLRWADEILNIYLENPKVTSIQFEEIPPLKFDTYTSVTESSASNEIQYDNFNSSNEGNCK